MDTAEDKAAKKFVETKLKGVEYLTIKTVKSDNPGRVTRTRRVVLVPSGTSASTTGISVMG